MRRLLALSLTFSAPITIAACDSDAPTADVIVQPVEMVQVPRADRVDFNNVSVFTCAS